MESKPMEQAIVEAMASITPMKRVFIPFFFVLCLSLAACTQNAAQPSSPSGPSGTTATTANPYPPVTSPVDFNSNGIDDYTDILIGARSDALALPRYDPSWFMGGYPPEDAGVCTDLVWRAFKQAGYDLKAMVDKDIAANVSLYPRVEGRPDPHIDFRRTANLLVFFRRHARSLTTDTTQYDQWQPGDIVTFGTWHSAIVSDRRADSGRPYILHNMGQPRREEDALEYWEISGHFRFDASQIDPALLVAFPEE